ncbi:hypothetical protein D3C72_1763600 [compost metagenome]
MDRTAGPVDAVAAQLARGLGQFGQVQRNDAAALDAAAAGPVGKEGKAHERGLAADARGAQLNRRARKAMVRLPQRREC